MCARRIYRLNGSRHHYYTIRGNQNERATEPVAGTITISAPQLARNKQHELKKKTKMLIEANTAFQIEKLQADMKKTSLIERREIAFQQSHNKKEIVQKWHKRN